MSHRLEVVLGKSDLALIEHLMELLETRSFGELVRRAVNAEPIIRGTFPEEVSQIAIPKEVMRHRKPVVLTDKVHSVLSKEPSMSEAIRRALRCFAIVVRKRQEYVDVNVH